MKQFKMEYIKQIKNDSGLDWSCVFHYQSKNAMKDWQQVWSVKRDMFLALFKPVQM